MKISPQLKALMGVAPSPPGYAPTSLSSSLGKAAFPSIFRGENPSAVRDLSAELEGRFNIFGQAIPEFNMFSAWTTPQAVGYFGDAEWLTHAWYDQPIQVPELAGEAQDVFGAPGPFGRGFLPMLMQSRQGRQDFARVDKDWWPTSVSRKVVEADKAEADGYTGRGVKTAAIGSDSGITITRHQQLMGRASGAQVRMIPMINSCGHEGHVATTMVGADVNLPNGVKVKGMATGATVNLIKCLYTPGGRGPTSDIIRAFALAIRSGAKIINMSLGGEPQGPPEDDPLCIPITESPKDRLVFVAAGNDPSYVASPGICPEAITVGSIGKSGRVSDFSGRGSGVDVVAPGENIYSGLPPFTVMDIMGGPGVRGYAPSSGTSMACPHAAGQAAQNVEAGLIHTRDDYKAVMKEYGDGKSNTRGRGIPLYSIFRKSTL